MSSEPLDSTPPLDMPDPSALDRLLGSKLGRLVKFGVVGGSGVVVNLGVFWIFFTLLSGSALEEGTRHTLSNGAGVLVSIFTNFLLNDSWTWGDRIKGERQDWLKRLVRYYISCSMAAGIQILTAHLAYSMLLADLKLALLGHELGPSLAVLIGIACGIAINFPISHLWAFKDAKTREDEDVML